MDVVDDYRPFVDPFVRDAIARGKRLVYFRFARHPELVPRGIGAEIHTLHPEVGFETFTARIHKVIEEAGRGAFYVFDCLSDLAADWYSDLMLGNFFMVTCPYLYDLDTMTYFALLRDGHSFDAVSSIRGTTQLLIDVFRHKDRLYVHPLKVDRRSSPTMYLPHVRDGKAFRPLTESAVLSEVLEDLSKRRVDTVSRTLDIWDRKLLQAREAIDEVRLGVRPGGEAPEIFGRLLRMMVTRDERLVALASRWFDLDDLLSLRKRMIGTGLIGGKSVGMLLARAILCKTDPRWRERLETHDSFYIGSDVFYTFLVRNGCWRRAPRTSATSTPSWTGRTWRGSGSCRAPSRASFRSSSWRCSTISASRRSSSGRAASWRTASATPSRGSTTASSARTRGRRRSASRRSFRRSAPSTPAR